MVTVYLKDLREPIKIEDGADSVFTDTSLVVLNGYKKKIAEFLTQLVYGYVISGNPQEK